MLVVVVAGAEDVVLERTELVVLAFVDVARVVELEDAARD